MVRRVLACIALLVSLDPFVRHADAQAAADAPPIPVALDKQQMTEFLATARVVGDKDIPVGITHPVRLTLDDGRVRHDAAFSSVNERQAVMRFTNNRTEIDFVDTYQYTLAAYRVAELLGLDDMMPVVVERQYQRRTGALAWWIDAQMDEARRRKEKISPPDREAWNGQVYRMRVFAQLVGDTDRNVGNILIDHQWKLWMIDFTRAFRHTRKLLDVNELQRCDRGLLDRLRALTKAQLTEKTKPYLGGAEIDALLARRDLIVARFEQLAAERGEARVFY